MARRPVIYIPASLNGRALYVGVTTDLGRRLEEHRRGMSIHTAQYNITHLVYIESCDTAPGAITREKQIKRWRREKKVALIDRANPDGSTLRLDRQSMMHESGVGDNDTLRVHPESRAG